MKNKIAAILQSQYFIIIIGLLGVLNYFLGFFILFTLILAVYTILIYIYKISKINLVLVFIMGLISLNYDKINMNYSDLSYFIIYSGFIFIGVLMIIDLIINFEKTKFDKKFILIAVFVLSVFELSILFNLDKNYSLVMIYEQLKLLGCFLIFLYFKNFKKNDEDISIYFIYMYMFVLLQITIEVLTSSNIKDTLLNMKNFNLSWCKYSTHLSMLLCFLSVFFIYFYKKTNKGLYLVPIVITFIMAIIFKCRASIIAYSIIVIGIVVYLFISNTNKKKVMYDVLLFVLVPFCLIIIILSFYILEDIINSLLNVGLAPHGRIELIEKGLHDFINNITFGRGYGSQLVYLKDEFHVYNYHNIYIQVLATTGILGFFTFFGALGYMIYKVDKKNVYNFVFLLFVGYLLLHGFFDTTFFTYRVNIIFSLAIIQLK